MEKYEINDKPAFARDRKEKAKTGGGSKAETGSESLQSSISSMLPQSSHSISNKFADGAVLHVDSDKTSWADEEVSYKDYKYI